MFCFTDFLVFVEFSALLNASHRNPVTMELRSAKKSNALQALLSLNKARILTKSYFITSLAFYCTAKQ
jgi:hypothetical protein